MYRFLSIHPRRRLAALLLAAVVLFTALPAGVSPLLRTAWAAVQEDSANSSEPRGLFVTVMDNRDFPSSSQVTEVYLRAQIDRITQTAAKNGFNTLYLETILLGEAIYPSKLLPHSRFLSQTQDFDPLSYWIVSAKEQGLEVVAVANLFWVKRPKDGALSKESIAGANPSCTLSGADGSVYLNPADTQVQKLAVKAVAELLGNYDLSGVLLESYCLPDGLSSDPEAAASGLTKILKDLQALDISAKKSIGISIGHSSSAFANGTKPDAVDPEVWIVQSLADYLLIDSGLTAQDGYGQELAYWLSLAQASGTRIYSYNDGERLLSPASGSYYGDTMELSWQLYLNQQLGVDGCVVGGAQAILSNFFDLSEQLLQVFTDTSDNRFSDGLEIPSQLSFTRPSDDLTTAYQRYYLMGTSNPDRPVYLNGEKIATQGRKGTFGVLVELEVGENTFTITQEAASDGSAPAASETIVLTREESSISTEPIPITNFVKSTLYPTSSTGIRAGESYTLRCTAPSGGEVSASVGGVTVSLTQVAAASDGVPALYKGTLTLPVGDAPADETVNLGTVTYTLKYNGVISTAVSAGGLYLVGEKADLTVTLTSHIGGVLKDPEVEGDYLTTLKLGSTDYVEEDTGTHFLLRSGGYLPKSLATINEGKDSIENTVSQVEYTAEKRGETFIFRGTALPPFHASMDDEKLTVTFFNTYGIDPADFADSCFGEDSLFSGVTVTQEDSAVTLTFAYRASEGLWGYSLEYDGTDTLLYCKRPPVRSEEYARPLTGVVVVLDAGHGGEDPGALGSAGTTGPTESQLNLATAEATRKRLEQLGATVYMTRSDDSRLSYEERMDPPQELRADFYLSFHHNSTGETTDSGKVSGVIIYYHEDISAALADNLAGSISAALGRKNNGSAQDYYRVTRMTFAPSVLMELGFLSNPLEYEQLCDGLNLWKTADAISKAILQSIPRQETR